MPHWVPESPVNLALDFELALSCCLPNLSFPWVHLAPGSLRCTTRESESSSHPAVVSTIRFRPNAERLCRSYCLFRTDDKSRRCSHCLSKLAGNKESHHLLVGWTVPYKDCECLAGQCRTGG